MHVQKHRPIIARMRTLSVVVITIIIYTPRRVIRVSRFVSAEFRPNIYISVDPFRLYFIAIN